MPRIVATRGLRLSEATKAAWRDAEVVFARSDRSDEEVLELMSRFGPDTWLLNLGQSGLRMPEGTPIWNPPDIVQQLVWPGLTRQLLGQFMPPQTDTFPAEVWIKTPGARGRGKFRKVVDRNLVLPREWDWQDHIEGQEYRIITVHNRIVQQHLRHGDNNSRRYEWLSMADTPSEIKTVVRSAARRLNSPTVLAWDTILSEEGNAYILEGNTAPGVNTATARRVVEQMNRSITEGEVAFA